MPIIKPKDIIAISALVLVAIMVTMGQQDGVTQIITGIIGYYFGHRHSGVDPGDG